MWDNVRSWWAVRNLPNVMLIHFNNLKEDLPHEILRIAGFLDIPIDAAKWKRILKHCSFDYMKEHATKSVPQGGAFWEGGAQTFLNKETNGHWKNVLSPEDILQYEKTVAENLSPECARWLATGEW